MSSSSFVGERGRGTTGTLAVIPFGGKSEDEEWLERDDHPLMNDFILKLLFSHIRRYDLKACRGVCKKWNEHTLPHMRSNFQVKIHEDENSETCHMDDFLKLFKSNVLRIPIEKFQLGPCHTTNDTDGPSKQFLEIYGESIKEIVLFQKPHVGQYVQTIENIVELLKFSPKLEALTLSGKFVSRSGCAVKLFPDSMPVLSALKTLTFKHDTLSSPITSCPCPTIVDELLKVAPNIFHIAIGDMGYYRIPKVCITQVLNSIERLGRESSIQTLTLVDVSFEHVEILKRISEKPNGLKLKGIRFSSDRNLEENRNTTVELATIFKDTLEDFNVTTGSRYLMDFPIMPNLKSFKFRYMEVLSPRPVDLIQMFPKLETFCLGFTNVMYISHDGSFWNGYLEFFSKFQVCSTVKTFAVGSDFVCPRTFIHILKVFPNLKKLTLSLGEETRQVLPQIFTRMPQLESLCLDARTYNDPDDVMKMDSFFTGISIQGLNQIRQVIPDMEKMTAEERRDKILKLIEAHKTQEPSIRNLADLKHLKLGVKVGWESISCLSDLTGYLGIYLMKRLIDLDIGYCNFTKTCCGILTRETGLEAWRFQTRHSGVIGHRSEHIIPPFGRSDIWN